MQSENSQENQLRQYTLAKQQIGELLHTGLQFFKDIKEESTAEHCRSLLVKLAEDRFNLVVVGQFKRGKSSLMNAVIGRDLLPTGLLPLTSAITTLCYGPQEKVILKRAGWTLDHEITFPELAEYVTEQGNPGNVKGVIEVRIELPVPFLRRGLYFVDTPGIGSTHSENTATTYSFLPKTDAVIFVTSVEAPLSEAEEAFLQDVRQYARRLFIVVNKVDLLAPNEHKQILDYIRTGVSRIVGEKEVRLFPLSARLALESKLLGNNHDDASLSGLDILEAALEKFLAAEKSQLFLVAILDQLTRTLSEVELRLYSNKIAPQTSLTQILDLHSKADSIRNDILGVVDVFSVKSETLNDNLQEIEATVFSVVERQHTALKTRTCPICAAQSRTIFDFFAQYQGKLAEENEVRQAFVVSKGFCQVHTWQFEQVASPQGISEGYVTFVETVASELRRAVSLPGSQSIKSIGQLLPDGDTCLACRLLRNDEVIQREHFLVYISTADGQEFYRRSLGLCLPHLQAVLSDKPPKKIREFLLLEQARHFEDLSEDMHSYTLKRDAIRSGLLNSNEENAWRRALVQLVGERTAHKE
jgi:GTP-binding protein EngB required for normal cell division